MRGDQLARQWRILRTIEPKKQGATVAELAALEDCHPRTIWRDPAVNRSAELPLLFQCRQKTESMGLLDGQPATRNLELGTGRMTMEVGGLRAVMSWVMGFGREAEVIEPDHLRRAVAQELAATTGKYTEETVPIIYQDDSQRRTA